jgi:citrate lyase subunit beta/citryl-CoA lyase
MSGAPAPSGLLRRSLLLAPASDATAVEAAAAARPDALCLDLEDTVPPAAKDRAREAVGPAVEAHAEVADVLVRLNGDRAGFEADLDACVRPGLDGVRMPKAEDPAEVAWLAEQIAARERDRGIAPGSVDISLLIESVTGLFAARELAKADPRVVGISLGHEDFARDIGVEPTPGGEESRLAELGLILVAREGGIHPLGALGRQSDDAGIRARCGWLRSVGFRGAATTDPGAIAAITESFTPGAAEIERAERVVAAYEEALAAGEGILVVEGIGMVDLPVAERARRLLAEAERAKPEDV